MRAQASTGAGGAQSPSKGKDAMTTEALDALVPGGAGWPPASACIPALAALPGLSDGDRAWLRARVAAVPGDWTAAWRAAEAAAPDRFARLLAAVYDAYYRAPAVARRLAALAEAGPRDPDAAFDPALLSRLSPEQLMTDTHITLSSPPDVAPATSYEHAARAGDFVFVAGQVARDEKGEWVGIGDAGRQAEQVYRNIGRILAHLGAGPRNVVKINTIMVDRGDRDAVTKARLDFFGDHRPPHTGIIVAGLGSPEVKIEVEVVAYLPEAR